MLLDGSRESKRNSCIVKGEVALKYYGTVIDEAEVGFSVMTAWPWPLARVDRLAASGQPARQ